MMVMVEQHLKHVLPPATVKRLKSHFDLARDALSKLPDQRSNRAWLSKVRVISPVQRLKAPTIKADVQEAVFSALLNERQLEVKFRQRNAERDSEGVVHPLAIVQRGAVTYLICTFYTYSDFRLLTLHRIQRAKVLDEPANRPANFSVDQLINKGLLGFGDAEPIQLVAEFYDGAGEHLFETPISPDQELERPDINTVRLKAPVQLTNELRWWLLGFGSRVQVLEPKKLRESIASEVAQASERY
ncbi:WYL domain-containing protein [Niveibacterium sp. 24ML]|uniref:helix-turn-helix transcriptional regulator n=1 Tax=Niveibacterium sp. 24ML TaxID=2985512 RepID=UPI00226E6C55|nr:WYL domain-containing protein [Niveibacterium sp. 24ML]MCX9157819.1 WYL domain-containing protein [Niveibacterium sp. 24ML]